MGRMRYHHTCTMALTHCPMRDVSDHGMHGLGGWSRVGRPWEGYGMAGGRMGESGGFAPGGNESVVNAAKWQASEFIYTQQDPSLGPANEWRHRCDTTERQMPTSDTPNWVSKKEKDPTLAER